MPFQIERIKGNVEDVRKCLRKVKAEAIVAVTDWQESICENYAAEIYKKLKADFQDRKLPDNIRPGTALEFSLDGLSNRCIFCVRGPFWHDHDDND